MTKQEVLEYVMNTPYNTNPAVLKSLLDGIEGGEGIEEITFDTIEYDDESWDFDVVTSDTLSTTEYQFITAADEEGFSVSGVLLPESGGKHYFITGDGTIFLVEQTENGYSFVHQGFLDSQNLSSLFREAYGDKIDELGGHDAEHEVGDDFYIPIKVSYTSNFIVNIPHLPLLVKNRKKTVTFKVNRCRGTRFPGYAAFSFS